MASSSIPIVVYIAAPLPLLPEARWLAPLLRAEGIAVVSSWHEGKATIEAENAMSQTERDEVAAICLAEVRACSVLALIYGPATERHGSVYEAATAAALGKPVVAIPVDKDAVLPTILLRGHPQFSVFDKGRGGYMSRDILVAIRAAWTAAYNPKGNG